ncbi:MAG: N-acetyl-gamma-glutamyl-phosphate reductase [Candidatus Sumerlaeia bacterium]|nr:N-acetyl-gamma-glutamyl-phosphate reductase [Candidatus Sumerlaeia bacterium]
MEKPVKVAIIGAKAFTAGELIRILHNHPRCEITALLARVDEPVSVGDVFGEFRDLGLPAITPLNIDSIPEDVQAAFLCLPHTVAAQMAESLFKKGIRVFDLSADFRYRNHRQYQTVYGVEHPCPELCRKAVYGLPEINAVQLMGAPLVACPGCYPTSVILALAPLMKREMIKVGSIIADCKSGVSGAGRTATEGTHFVMVNENFKAYKVAEHRHQSEIEEQLSLLSHEEQTVTFVPHLVPMDRGILSTVYGKLVEPLSLDAVQSLYRDYYGDSQFVRLLEGDALPETKHVSRSNFCDLAIRIDQRSQRLIVVSAIDNLIKGASGQAVQCMNLSFGMKETLGFFPEA